MMTDGWMPQKDAFSSSLKKLAGSYELLRTCKRSIGSGWPDGTRVPANYGPSRVQEGSLPLSGTFYLKTDAKGAKRAQYFSNKSR